MPATTWLSLDTISVQLYTVREAVAQDLDQTLERIAAIGYRQVEPFGFPARADALADGLKRHGLAAPTAHASLLDADHLDDLLSAARDIGIGTLIDPHTDPARWNSTADIAATAEGLNAAARRAADYGLRVGYHNHAFELESVIDGTHGLEILAHHLAPEVILEVDTYWAYAGGADVPALLKRLGDRVQALHIKDGDGSKEPTNQVAVGSGSLPVPDFVDAAPAMRHGVVELDDSATDRFVAIADSLGYLTGREPGPSAAAKVGRQL